MGEFDRHHFINSSSIDQRLYIYSAAAAAGRWHFGRLILGLVASRPERKSTAHKLTM